MRSKVSGVFVFCVLCFVFCVVVAVVVSAICDDLRLSKILCDAHVLNETTPFPTNPPQAQGSRLGKGVFMLQLCDVLPKGK